MSEPTYDLLSPLPWVSLGEWPTPIRAVEVAGVPPGRLWVKDEGLAGTVYGGNKVRKLEFLLASARARGATELVTVGAAGSHHVLATALYGHTQGMRTHALLFSQPETDHARRNLSLIAAQCASLRPCRRRWALPFAAVATWRNASRAGIPYYVPPGGSDVVGSLGWLRAGLEIGVAVGDGTLPEPDRIYVPVGTGGTAAGLLVGLRLAGLRSELVGVRVVPFPLGTRWVVRRLVRRLVRFLRRNAVALPPLSFPPYRVESGWISGGYGRTDARVEAVEREAAEVGLVVEATYTAKCLGACLSDLRAADTPFTALFIDTVNSRALEPSGGVNPLPVELEALLTL
ncbi:MAG: pyridoxal-phosphate dependent enzyme [Deltaproteobacteria bacterium]|nr:pyridoxal-phosphate dependent enzyme [Deltaproteobacteria bacterium]